MTFDPNSFLAQTFDGTNDTSVTPCPEGEFAAVADKVEMKQWASKDGSKSGLKVNILWDVQDEAAKAHCGRDTVKVGQDIMLDLTESGALDMSKGRNVRLGRLREALDLNSPGRPFSFSMVQGRMAKVKVGHRVDGEDIYAEVRAVARL